MKASQKRTSLLAAGWTVVNGKVWYPPAPTGTIQDHGYELPKAWAIFKKEALVQGRRR